MNIRPTPDKKVFINNALGGFELPYNLFLPEDYREDKQYPVMMFLHGAGERGNDNEKQLVHVVYKLYETCPELMNGTILIVPQCPCGDQWVNWSWTNGNYSTDEIPESRPLSSAVALLKTILETYPCDRDRVYIMGISMGGYGTWDVLARHGELIAAGIPICGGGDPSKADKLKEIPIWCSHGTADDAVRYAGTEGMYKAIKAAGGDKITFVTVEGGGHGIWDLASTNAELIKWLFARRLSERS